MANIHVKRVSSRLSMEGGHQRKVRYVNAATYVVQQDDDILEVPYSATGVVGISIPVDQWPTVAGEMRVISVKDTGNANANNITITPAGGVLIDGAANLVLNTQYDSVDIGLSYERTGVTKQAKIL